MRTSRTLTIAGAVVAIAGLTAGCGSGSKATTKGAPSVSPSTQPGSRAWTTTITDGDTSFSAVFTLGPVQKLSAYPGGVGALQTRCESATGLHFNASGDALVGGTLTVTNRSGSPASVKLVLNPLQSPPLWPVLTAGSSCTGSDLRGMRLAFANMAAGATTVRSDFAFVLSGYYTAGHPEGDPLVAAASFVSIVAMGTASSVSPLSGPGAYQHAVPVIPSADAAAYCHKTGKQC